MIDTLNIVVVGKSGVGKSSFLNYLLGKDIFLTGVGAPITQTYFDMREMPANDQGVKYVLYDTKGIEPTTTNECKRRIIEEIDRRDRYENFFEWIHSVYYCFDSTSGRIETFEENFIKELEKKVSIIVLLTKSDLTSKERIDSLTQEIHKRISPSVLVIPVCSIESNGTRKNPMKIHRFGREEVLKASFYGLWNKIAAIIPIRSIEGVNQEINELQPVDFSFYKNVTLQKTIDFSKRYLGNEPNIERLSHINNSLSSMSVNLSKQVYDKVIDFYKKVNRFTPQIFFMTESQTVLSELKNYDASTDIDNINASIANIIYAMNDLNDCWIYDNAEKKVLAKEIEHYNEAVNSIKKRLQTKIDRFVQVYKGELLQYGRLCISNEKVESDNFVYFNDLSKDEHLYAKMIKYALSNDRNISSDERNLLDRLRTELQISEIKAGRIEDYIRNN